MTKQFSIFDDQNIAKRRKKAERFRKITLSSLVVIALFLVFFIGDLFYKGLPGLTQTQMRVSVAFSEKTLTNERTGVSRTMRTLISRADLRRIKQITQDNPSFIGQSKDIWFIADDQVDQYLKDNPSKLKPSQIELIDEMRSNHNIKQVFNLTFFTNGDSKQPEQAGIYSSIMGTILTMIVTLAIAFPIGVATAIYLEEFAKDNVFTRFIEININNLAAIPSILFGILGLAIFINVLHIPRSSALVGGLTLALMVLPIIVVSTRAALKTVQDKIKNAGYALGLSRWQVIRDIILPNAMGGILTGSIISLAQAIGETAPLIMVGMVAFVPEASYTIFEPSTVMPAQIFTWAGMPESMYIEKTALGILTLLSIMVSLNLLAIMLRRKFQK